jgi:Cu/Ag efflux protein CusF
MRRLAVLLMLAALAAPVAAATPAIDIARIHGTITKIDRARHTFWIHHDPFKQMPMSMTMEVEPVRLAELYTLHKGEVVNVTVDTTVVPWPGSNIRRAK